MAELGQSSDPSLDNYHEGGLPLIHDYIGIITPEDHNPPYIDTARLIRRGAETFSLVGQLKVRSWVGPDYVANTAEDVGGVQWIPASEWWPYQRPTFVTPPFAGYVSGHSTYSRAAAEVLTMMTGDEYFPGGVGEFIAEKNNFLVFENGPSEDVVLQWATYRDASDQTSLSRIWGGIHPPADDIPGRLIGEQIGIKAFLRARTFFKTSSVDDNLLFAQPNIKAYPNPIQADGLLQIDMEQSEDALVTLADINGKVVYREKHQNSSIRIPMHHLQPGNYIVTVLSETFHWNEKVIHLGL